MGAIAIIPARGGSKRIPRKNIREFCGKPIIGYSIELAARSGLFDEVQVSTDDAEIEAVAREFGASVPRCRPAKLSDDRATFTEVTKYEAEQTEAENLCFLVATAPLLRAESLRGGWDEIRIRQRNLVFSVLRFSGPVQRGFKLNEKGQPRMLWPEQFNTRSQDLPPVYHDAGQFYWGRNEMFRTREGSLFEVENTGVMVLDSREVVDIDTEEDWRLAEQMFQLRQSANEPK